MQVFYNFLNIYSFCFYSMPSSTTFQYSLVLSVSVRSCRQWEGFLRNRWAYSCCSYNRSAKLALRRVILDVEEDLLFQGGMHEEVVESVEEMVAIIKFKHVIIQQNIERSSYLKLEKSRISNNLLPKALYLLLQTVYVKTPRSVVRSSDLASEMQVWVRFSGLAVIVMRIIGKKAWRSLPCSYFLYLEQIVHTDKTPN